MRSHSGQGTESPHQALADPPALLSTAAAPLLIEALAVLSCPSCLFPAGWSPLHAPNLHPQVSGVSAPLPGCRSAEMSSGLQNLVGCPVLQTEQPCTHFYITPPVLFLPSSPA